MELSENAYESINKKPARIFTVTEFNLLISSLHFPFPQQQLDTVATIVMLIDKIQYNFYYDSIYLESVKQKPKVALCIQTHLNQSIIIIYYR